MLIDVDTYIIGADSRTTTHALDSRGCTQFNVVYSLVPLMISVTALHT